jgi:hypothetical protein
MNPWRAPRITVKWNQILDKVAAVVAGLSRAKWGVEVLTIAMREIQIKVTAGGASRESSAAPLPHRAIQCWMVTAEPISIVTGQAPWTSYVVHRTILRQLLMLRLTH